MHTHKRKFEKRSISYVGKKAWSDFSVSLQELTDTMQHCKKQLKTHLFTLAYIADTPLVTQMAKAMAMM